MKLTIKIIFIKGLQNTLRNIEGDKLHNHYSYQQFGNYARLVWLDTSDLDIKDEVENAFREIFVH